MKAVELAIKYYELSSQIRELTERVRDFTHTHGMEELQQLRERYLEGDGTGRTNFSSWEGVLDYYTDDLKTPYEQFEMVCRALDGRKRTRVELGQVKRRLYYLGLRKSLFKTLE